MWKAWCSETGMLCIWQGWSGKLPSMGFELPRSWISIVIWACMQQPNVQGIGFGIADIWFILQIHNLHKYRFKIHLIHTNNILSYCKGFWWRAAKGYFAIAVWHSWMEDTLKVVQSYNAANVSKNNEWWNSWYKTSFMTFACIHWEQNITKWSLLSVHCFFSCNPANLKHHCVGLFVSNVSSFSLEDSSFQWLSSIAGISETVYYTRGQSLWWLKRWRNMHSEQLTTQN